MTFLFGNWKHFMRFIKTSFRLPYFCLDSRSVGMWLSDGFGADFTLICFITKSSDPKVLWSSLRASDIGWGKTECLKTYKKGWASFAIVCSNCFDWFCRPTMHDHSTALLLSNKGRWKGALCISTAVVLNMTDCLLHLRSKNGMTWLKASWLASAQEKNGRWASRLCLSPCGWTPQVDST